MYDNLPARLRGVRKAEQFIREHYALETMTPTEFQNLGRFYAKRYFKTEKAQRLFATGWDVWGQKWFHLMKPEATA